MDSENNTAIEPDTMAVIVEMGNDFSPGPRTTAALAMLVEALHDEHGAETEGFTFDPSASIRNFAYVSPGADGTVAQLKWNDITLKRGYVEG